jgi:hypothetical protein
MTEWEKAKDRFVAYDAVNLGKTQCFDCKHFELSEFLCHKLDKKETAQYKGNSKGCPYNEIAN